MSAAIIRWRARKYSVLPPLSVSHRHAPIPRPLGTPELLHHAPSLHTTPNAVQLCRLNIPFRPILRTESSELLARLGSSSRTRHNYALGSGEAKRRRRDENLGKPHRDRNECVVYVYISIGNIFVRFKYRPGSENEWTREILITSDLGKDSEYRTSVRL
jgi:hypothetical protein